MYLIPGPGSTSPLASLTPRTLQSSDDFLFRHGVILVRIEVLPPVDERYNHLRGQALRQSRQTFSFAVTDQMTEQEKIGVALGSLAAFWGIFIFGCCCCYWKRRPGTKRSKKCEKPRTQMTQYKEPLVQVDERPWTSQWLKWKVKKGKIEYADSDV